jgi:methionine aminotransferase
MQQRYGRTFDIVDNITVTLGATEALFSSVQALVHAGDEVIVFDPSYDSYAPAIILAGAKPIHIPLLPPTFAIDWQQVRDAITPRTRMIIVNSPHNPTTAVLTAADVDELAAMVRNTNILILSDEVYEHMLYDGRQHQCLVAHAELGERTLSVFSFGKSIHATGWRVGYAVAPTELTRELRRVHQFNTFSIAAPLQTAIAEFLQQTPDHNDGLAKFYQDKRDFFLSRIKNSRFDFEPSPGSFFQLLDFSAISSASDVQFAETLLTQVGVASIPLSPFYASAPKLTCLRFCFAKTEALLEQAAERLCRL